jgi:hypothetical protein
MKRFFRWVVAILIAIPVGIYLLLFSKSTPLRHRDLTPERLRMLIETFFFRGADRATITIGIDDNPQRALTFEKYILSQIGGPNRVGLRTELRSSLLGEDYAGVRDALLARGTPFEEISPTQVQGENALRIDLGEDVERAAGITELVFRDAWRVSLERECYLFATRIFLGNARVGWSS